MLISRHHERYDLSTSITIHLVIFLTLGSRIAVATPLQDTNIRKRNDPNDPQALTPRVYVPVIILVVVLLAVGMMAWRKYAWDKTTRLFSSSRAEARPPGAPRELTAEQLAGTINGDNPAMSNAPRPARRPRRTRRTPSQMSVTSLPAYNKEPGEEELVIFRGRDAEDVTTMPTAVAVTSLDEERDESVTSHDNSQTSRYSPMPTSTNDMPLLQDDGDLSMQSLISPTGADLPRRNVDDGQETSSLMRTNSDSHGGLPDPRGDAPAYLEVVDADSSDAQQHNTDAVISSSHNRTSSVPGNNHNRRSGFRNLLNRMSMVGNTQPGHGHSRNESNFSNFSSNLSHGQELTSGTRHRPTLSSSSSLLSGSMFRTLSRQRSTRTLNNLNSPSMISLNSISAPLTHTVTRTEFTYPKSGPTPEQLKMISSRESFGRFGVPYGPDAVAFASSSRLDLSNLPPPPHFEQGSGSGTSPSTNPSRLRTSSNVAQDVQNPSTLANEQSPDDTASTNANIIPPAPSQLASIPTSQNDVTSPSVSSPPLVRGSISKSHNSVSGSQPANMDSGTTSSAMRTNNTQVVSEFGKLSAPPSAYNEITASSTRSESRTSFVSYQSYATAAESISASMRTTAQSSVTATFTDAQSARHRDGESDSELESVYGSAPPTPRIGGQHVLDATDSTIIVNSSPVSKRNTIIASKQNSAGGSYQ